MSSNAFVDATAGGVGASVALTLMYPLVVVKTRLQGQKRKTKAETATAAEEEGEAPETKREEVARRTEAAASAAAGLPTGGDLAPFGSDAGSTEETEEVTYNGPLDCLAKSFRSGGAAGLYAGIPTALVKTFINNYIFYFAFSSLRPFFFPDTLANKKGVLRSILHGMSAGVVVQLCIMPLDMIVNRLMCDREGKGVLQIVNDIYTNEGGVAGFWKSLRPALVLTLNPGITTTVRNLLTPAAGASAAANFRIGLVSKAVASLTTYPYVVAKVQMQVSKTTVVATATTKKSEEGEEAEGGMVGGEASADGILEAAWSEVTGEEAQPPQPPQQPQQPQQEQLEQTEGSARRRGALQKLGLLAKVWAWLVSLLPPKLVDMYREGGIRAIYKGSELQVFNAMLKEGILNMVRLQINTTIRRMAGIQDS